MTERTCRAATRSGIAVPWRWPSFRRAGQKPRIPRIRFDARYGWVWGGFAPRVKATTIRVTYSGGVNVRTGPGSGYSKLGSAYLNYRYGFGGTSGSWTKIWYRGRTAWVISASVVRVAL